MIPEHQTKKLSKNIYHFSFGRNVETNRWKQKVTSKIIPSSFTHASVRDVIVDLKNTRVSLFRNVSRKRVYGISCFDEHYSQTCPLRVSAMRNESVIDSMWIRTRRSDTEWSAWFYLLKCKIFRGTRAGMVFVVTARCVHDPRIPRPTPLLTRSPRCHSHGGIRASG